MSSTAPSAASGRRFRRIIARAVLAAVALLLAVYLGISALAAHILTTPRRSFDPSETPASFSLAYQDVRFPAREDGLMIAGWYIPYRSSHRAVVLVHGKDSIRTREFRGDFVDLAAALHKSGFAVLMIDLRGHGQSDAARFGFGLRERRDVLGAVDWLKSQGFRPGSIGVLGVSMGAASSIGAAVEEPAIGALVEDSGYAAIYPIIQKEWEEVSRLPDFFLQPTLLIGRLLLGYDITTARPVEEIDDIAPRPVMIIHGRADQLVPLDDAEQLRAANPGAELWVVPGAGHARAYNTDPRAYVERVAGFFRKNLRP
jgi:dipeptidyl aminopeptidase/acylaminoacyl peptidase